MKRPKWLTKRRFLLAAALLGWWGHDGARGQGFPAADCPGFSFQFTATGRQPVVGATTGYFSIGGCTNWTITYNVIGFSAISLRLDSAVDASPAAAPGTVPGTWGAFVAGAGGTVGINPNTAVTGGVYTTINGSNPWISANLTSATGSGLVYGYVYGYRQPNVAGGASGPTANVNIVTPVGQAAMAASIPVVIASNQTAVPVSGTVTVNGTVGVTQPVSVGGQAASGAADAGNPVKVGGSNGTNDYNLKVDSQGNTYGYVGCLLTADVALSGTGLTEIVVGTAAQVIQICKVIVTSVSGGNPVVNTFTISSATISTCAGATELFLAGGVTGIDSDWGGALRSGSGKSICVSESVANSDKVTISYQKAAF